MTTTNYWKPILATALPRTGLSIAPAMAILALACLIAALEPEAAGQVRNEIRIDAADIYANPPVGQTLEIVVKFKDDAKVKDILDTFWKDAQAARAKFDVFKKGQPEMAGASLARVTYSNELVLAYQFKGATKAQRVAEAREISSRLISSPDILYAEPDFSLQTQG